MENIRGDAAERGGLDARMLEEGNCPVCLFRYRMLRSPNLDKPEEAASRTLEEMASRTLEERKYQVFQFRYRMLRSSKYSAIYAVVPDGRGAQFALACGQKLKAPLPASPPVYRAEY